MRIRAGVAVVVVLSVASVVSAGEWFWTASTAKEGQWARYRVSRREKVEALVKLTVVKVDAEAKKVVVEEEAREGSKEPKVRSRERALGAACDEPKEGAEVKEETLEVAGRKIKCRSYDTKSGRATVSDEVPFQAVKLTYAGKGQTIELTSWGDKSDPDKGWEDAAK